MREHNVVELRDSVGREQLLTEVWGPRSMRRRVAEASKVGAGGAASSALGHGCDIGLGSLDLGWLLVVFMVFAGIYLLVTWLLERRRKRKALPRSRPARTTGAVCERVRGAAGTVVATKAIPDPLTNVSCVAYGAELRSERGVMLRDAVTIGFDVALASGDTVRVPAGPILIDMATAREPSLCTTDAYRRSVDPLRVGASDLDPLPGKTVLLREVRPGDAVELIGELVRTPTPASDLPGGYRDGAPSVLVPRGLVRLRPC